MVGAGQIVLNIIILYLLAVSASRRNHHDDDVDHSVTLENDDDLKIKWRNQSVYMSNIFLKVYGHDNELVYGDSIAAMGTFFPHEWCHPWAPFALIVHGWLESCETRWVPMLVSKLRQHRGGCIMCMDYSHYSGDVYHRLVRNFNPIVNALTIVLLQLVDMGVRMEQGYVFGFSFGGQLATEAGRRIGFGRLHEIDTCDMAGPGFDHRKRSDHRMAAQNVQCIHTSRDKGTRYYSCHQNWRLGNCGFTQPAAGPPPLGSHGLCPYMYVSSFDFEFRAVQRPIECVSRAPALGFPVDYRMGYLERRKFQVTGELFAFTSSDWPYAVDHGVENITVQVPVDEYMEL